MAQAALRWVMDRPGVASTIIGARSIAQLDDNMAAMAVRLDAEDIALLDGVSRPELPFPCEFLDFVRTGIQNGTTVNGIPSEPWPMSPRNDAERW